jgi:formylglycine-generating enzyme required for sulfatase activity
MKIVYFKLLGCSWINFAQLCRLASRLSGEPAWRDDNLGFRIFQEYK